MLNSRIAGNDTDKQDCVAGEKHPGQGRGGGVSSGDPDSSSIYVLVAL